jgi:hypothetical protein
VKDYQGQLLAEYTALRAEVLQRMATRHQLVTFSVAVLGAIIAFEAPTSTLLVYPVFGLFLALGWAHNDFRIAEIGKYVRKHIETELPGLNWETYFFNIKSPGPNLWHVLRATILSAGGIIVGTQWLALLIPLLKNQSPSTWVFVLDVLVMLLTLYILYSRKRHFRKK